MTLLKLDGYAYPGAYRAKRSDTFAQFSARLFHHSTSHQTGQTKIGCGMRLGFCSND